MPLKRRRRSRKALVKNRPTHRDNHHHVYLNNLNINS